MARFQRARWRVFAGEARRNRRHPQLVQCRRRAVGDPQCQIAGLVRHRLDQHVGGRVARQIKAHQGRSGASPDLRIRPGRQPVVLDGPGRIARPLRQTAQGEMRGGGGQQPVSLFQVALRTGLVAQLLARLATVQVVGEILAVALDRLVVFLLSLGDAAQALQRIATQAMEQRLARLGPERLVGLGQGLFRLFRQQLAALVVGGVGRLALHQAGDL
jgi:hypothetical protein